MTHHHHAFWHEQSERRQYPSLEGDTHADIVVIGAGITGLTAAMLLKDAGKKVIVLDMKTVGGGTTGHSTGHLDMHIDDTLEATVRRYGKAKTRLVVDSRKAALDLIELWNRRFGLNCDFKRVPAYYYTERESEISRVDDEHRAAQELDIPCAIATDTPLPFPFRKALRLDWQARFNPLQYVSGLAQAFVGDNCWIYQNTQVKGHKKSGSLHRIKTDRGTVTCDQVVVAAHTPLFSLITLESRAYPWQSYVLGLRVTDDIPDALYWDMMDPYHYARWAKSDDPKLLLVGGADHRTGEKVETNECYDSLESYARIRYRVDAVTHRWSHEFYEPADGLPYIGRMPGKDGVFIGAAYSGTGLSWGTVAGIVIADQIMGRENAWENIYDPSRINAIASARRFVPAMGRITKHYLGDRIAGADVDSVDDVPRGEGRLVKINGDLTAVYNDDDGSLHAMSPICQHAGCVVHWNSAEKTWDCPCHGGRYDAHGKVIQAPPASDLPKKTPAELEHAKKD